MKENRNGLAKVLGRMDVLALAFGTMVGWAWIMFAGLWIQGSGVLGAILAFAAGALLCILVGMIYAEMTSALPLAGGEMVYAYRSLGYRWSWFAGWMIALAYIGVAAWEGIALATAMEYIFDIPKIGFIWDSQGHPVYLSWSIIGSIAAFVLMILNHFGARPAAIFQIMTTGGLMVVGLMFLFGGISFGDIENFQPLFTDRAGFAITLLMVPSMMIGFDIIPQSIEEMNIPLRDVSRLLIISIIMAAFWYMLMIVGISLSAPIEVRESGIIPVADSMRYAYGYSIFGKILIIGGICGILTSWNGFIMGATRILFAMGRAKMLPSVFGRLHPKYKTPTAAIILVCSICCLTPMLGRNALIWFVNVSSFASVVSYLMVSISFLVLRKKEPNLIRPYKIRAGVFIGICAILYAGCYIILYLPFGTSALVWPQEWIIIFIWAALGFIFHFCSKKVPAEDRELLIYGEDYARKEAKK